MIKKRDGRGKCNASCKKKARKAANINNVVIAQIASTSHKIYPRPVIDDAPKCANVLNFKA